MRHEADRRNPGREAVDNFSLPGGPNHGKIRTGWRPSGSVGSDRNAGIGAAFLIVNIDFSQLHVGRKPLSTIGVQ
jgi:hypothetical protein